MKSLLYLFLLMFLSTITSQAQENKYRKIRDMQTGEIAWPKMTDANLKISLGDTVVLLLEQKKIINKNHTQEIYSLDTAINHASLLLTSEGDYYYNDNKRLIKARKQIILSNELSDADIPQEFGEKDTVDNTNPSITGPVIFLYLGIAAIVVMVVGQIITSARR